MQKVALVTGATRGIGFAIAYRLAKEGHKVYIASIEKEIEDVRPSLEKLRAEENIDLKTVVYDAFDRESYEPMMNQILSSEGRLDILVNNFGISSRKTDLAIDHINYDDFDRFFNANVQSVMLPIMLALPSMKKTGGCIINISSIGGRVPDLTQMAYGASKAAICHITKMVALQQAAYKIRCNAILPGIVETDAVKRSLTPEFKQFFLRHVPLGRMAACEEIADTVVFLTENEYITGQDIEVTGGYGMGTPMYADMIAMAKKMKA